MGTLRRLGDVRDFLGRPFVGRARVTVFACDFPWNGHFYVWGENAPAYIYAAGGDPETQRVREFNAWEAYRVTPVQLGNLVALGVTLTDKYGPAIWLAERDGDARRLAMLQKARALA